MPKKERSKANGEGTVYQEQRNGRPYYRAQVSVGYDEKGRVKRKSFSGYSKKDVLKRMREYQHKNDSGQLPADDKLTLAQWFHTWLFDFRIHDMKPSTFERYEGIYRNYIEDTPVGDIRLAELRASHLQGYFNNLLENGKSADVAHTIKRFLGTCLIEAERQKYIPVNYCKSVRLPKQTTDETEDEGEITALTKDEQTTLIKSIQGHKYEMAMLLALATGVRLGELLALKWPDINFTNGNLHVTRSIKRVTLIDKDGNRTGKIIEQSPKTKSSIRTVPIPVNIIAKLKQHKKKQLEVKFEKGEFYNDSGYIFCNEFGNPEDTKKIPRNFKSALKRAGIRDMKFHALRHTYCTRLFEAEVPIKTVQILMGHKRIETTMNIYTHVMAEQKDLAAEKINALFV
jgi:integrase